MNSCSLSRKTWGELIVRFWIQSFKNGWSYWKIVLMEMVNLLSAVSLKCPLPFSKQWIFRWYASMEDMQLWTWTGIHVKQ
jgi:hypothetical protein